MPRTLASLERIAPGHRSSVQIVAVNDGSRDGTSGLLRAFEADTKGFDVVVIDQPNQGLSGARNAALARAGGEWIFFLDSDDELAFDPLPCLLRASAGVTCLGFSIEYQFPSGRRRLARPALVGPANFMTIFSSRNPFQPSSLIFRHDRVDRPFDSQVNIVNDWLFWMSNPRVFDRMELLARETSVLVHVHGSNMSGRYEELGYNRAVVSERMLVERGETLTAHQRNNFRIQACIGGLQSRGIFPWSALTAWPCSFSLYVKLWIYLFASLVGRRATYYHRDGGNGSGS